MNVLPRLIGLLCGTLGRLVGAILPLLLSACQQMTDNHNAYKPISPSTIAPFQEKGRNSNPHVLIRTFKKEAELEVWKLELNGKYALFKTFPICRWSGQLGPKTREGDRQVPEGFYAITPGQMNQNSKYHLSFNVGYPNAYDKANGYTGGLIMVHGACSSAGCFSMTDEQITEIYTIVSKAFAGGQKTIQLQSLPFRMTPENLAKHRLDRNIKFWKEIKQGSDIFEVTKQEPKIGVCEKNYVFKSMSANGGRMDASEDCLRQREDEGVRSAVAAKERDDEEKVHELAVKGVQPVKVVYSDGGQNPKFDGVQWVSRPESLLQGPVEIPLDDTSKLRMATIRVPASNREPTQLYEARPVAASVLIKTLMARVETSASPGPVLPQLSTRAPAVGSLPSPVYPVKFEVSSVFADFVRKLGSIEGFIGGNISREAPIATADSPLLATDLTTKASQFRQINNSLAAAKSGQRQFHFNSISQKLSPAKPKITEKQSAPTPTLIVNTSNKPLTTRLEATIEEITVGELLPPLPSGLFNALN